MEFNIFHLLLLGVIGFLLYLYFKDKCKCDNHKPMAELTNLWVEHLMYTRLTFMAFFRDSPELEIVKQRLLQNQIDIGSYFSKNLGPNVGNYIAKLLTEHILIAVDVLTAIKQNDTELLEGKIKNFYDNADEIGQYVDKLKGTKGVFRHHMKMHIQTLVNSITAFVTQNYEDDVKWNDAYMKAGIQMSFDMA